MTTSISITMTTVSEESKARALAKALINRGMAACVQIFPIESYYVWENELQEDREYLLLIKHLASTSKEIHSWLSANHPYETPEIITTNADLVSEEYLSWVRHVSAKRAETGKLDQFVD